MAVRFGVIDFRGVFGEVLDTVKDTFGNLLQKSCFIFQNDSSFNLKQYLLGLKEKLGFELTGIFYCENANTHKKDSQNKRANE